MGPARVAAMLARVREMARRPAVPAHRVTPTLASRTGWGPPAQQPRPWTPNFGERARAAWLILCGAIVAGAVVAGVLGFVVWLIAAGIHHAATN